MNLKINPDTMKKLGIFAGGLLFGTAGIKILSSKDAKKVYTNTTAAVLRGKKCVMQTVSTIRENCDDILADAKDINEQREAEEIIIKDSASEEVWNVKFYTGLKKESE